MLDLLDNIITGVLAGDKNYEPNIGDHIYVPRTMARDLQKCDDFKDWDTRAQKQLLLVGSVIGYSHHGIYIGGGKVIHYDGEPGREDAAEIQISSLEKFSAGDPVNLYSDESEFTPGEIVARAHYRLGERKYSVENNNCQHFCNWCRGDSSDGGYYPEVSMETILKKFRANNEKFSMQLSKYDISDGIILGGTVSAGSISVGDKIKVIQQPRKGHLSEGQPEEEIATLTVKKLRRKNFCKTARAGDTVEITVDGFVSCINMYNYLIVS